MHWISLGLALLLALAIIVIGIQYLTRPRATTLSFGLPLPEEGPNIAWWLRLKGVRDVASGLTVLACFAWTGPRTVGVVLLALATIPLGDMLMVLSAKGSSAKAFGIHGVTMIVMLIASLPLVLGA